MIRSAIAAILAFIAVAIAPITTEAQTLTPPSLIWGGGPYTSPAPVQVVGYDSATGAACIVGSTATCVTPTNTDTATLVALTAQGAATVNSADQLNVGGQCAVVGINLTTMTTATVTVTVQGKDVSSGQYYTLLASTGLTTTGFTTLTICPGSTAAANAVATLPLPRTWRVSVTVAGGAAAATGKIGASVVN